MRYDVCECGAVKRSAAKRCRACYDRECLSTRRYCPECGARIEARATRCRPCSLRARTQPRMHQGYLTIRDPGHPLANVKGYVFVHRKVLHAAGVEIPTGHVVHHKNGDRLDNRIENLAVLSKSEHAKLHARLRRTVEHDQAGYARGCRCDVCRQANTDYCRNSRARRRQPVTT